MGEVKHKEPFQMFKIFSVNGRNCHMSGVRSGFEKTGEGLRSLAAERECGLTKDKEWLRRIKYRCLLKLRNECCIPNAQQCDFFQVEYCLGLRINSEPWY